MLMKKKEAEAFARAAFVRKAVNLKEVREATRGGGESKMRFIIAEEIHVPDERFRYISNHLSEDTPEIAGGKGGTINNVIQAIRIVNEDTGESFLANPEGYSYIRYAALDTPRY